MFSLINVLIIVSLMYWCDIFNMGWVNVINRTDICFSSIIKKRFWSWCAMPFFPLNKKYISAKNATVVDQQVF